MIGSPLLRRAFVLGMLMAVGPFAVDMYLPGFAAIARDLGTDEGSVQLSLVSFFLALALGQVFWGPISDRMGRKPPVYAGIGLFVVASIGCAFAPDIDTLIALRFLQGLGACAGTVVTIATIRDLHTGAEAARLLSLALLALSLSPILAPILGGALVELVSWRAIFWVLAALSLMIAALVAAFLPETRPPEERIAIGLRATFQSYGRLLRDRRFIAAVMTAGFAQSALFAYIAGSSFLLITLYGVSPFTYSLIFAANAIGLIGAAQLNGRLIHKLGAPRLIGRAVTGLLLAALAFAALVLAGVVSLPLTVLLLFLTLGCMGFIMPPATMLALEPFGALAGTASALANGLQFLISTVATLLVGGLFDGTARPMALMIAVAALGSFVSWQWFKAGAARRLAATDCRA
jgi:DHA1 family bicyclomycin/chloramphenicol resistance-like MFS transporter